MKTIGVLLLVAFLARQALALPNPAAVYCELLGYEYTTMPTPAGVKGMVEVEPGVRFDAWDFFKGKVGNEYGFGALYGYDTECVRTNLGTCTLEYAVCVPRAQKNLKGAARIPLLEFMDQKGVPLVENTRRKDTQASSSGTKRATLEEDMVPLYDIMAQGKTLPASFDWRAHNGHAYIGPVRDQGYCGSCYAFAANAAAEGAYNRTMLLYDGNCADFSESFIIWCLGRLSQYNHHFDGCGGADWDYAELTALTVEGVCSEADFPYTITDPGSCVHWSNPRTVFSAWHRIACSDIEAIKTAIMTYGVVDAAVNAANFNAYSGGIYSDTRTNCPPDPSIGPECYYTYTDHAIALVGWDDNPPEGGGGCWILRNSWGANWGESGYMRIRYQAARVACAASYLVCLGPNTHTLAITSAHGGAYPPAGIVTNNDGVSITCSITNSPLTSGATQHVCVGWTGSGSVPATGVGTNTGVFILNNDSTITWLWRTNFYLALTVSGPGTVNRSSGWQAQGSNVTLTATPRATAYFIGWSGATDGCVMAENQISIPMTGARAITATFGTASLAAPTGAAASQGSFTDKIALTWNKVSAAAGYRIWRSVMNLTNAVSLIGSSTMENYNDTGAKSGIRYYYWIKATNASAVSAFSASATGWQKLPPAETPQVINGDYDGDAKADPAVFAGGRWFIRLSSDDYSLTHLSFGGSNDTAFAGDFDGDGKADPVVYETASGKWQVQMSGSGYAIATMENFGGPNHQPVPGDYDGDDKADPAIYNTVNGNWRIMLSGSGYGIATVVAFGGAGFKQVAGNYDADNRADPGIYANSNGNWTIMLSGQGYSTAALPTFGAVGSEPLMVDFDGDGLVDPAFYKESTRTWAIQLSGLGYGTAVISNFGGATYMVGAADYDGDGKADPALLDITTGTWHIQLSASGYAEATLASGWRP